MSLAHDARHVGAVALDGVAAVSGFEVAPGLPSPRRRQAGGRTVADRGRGGLELMLSRRPRVSGLTIRPVGPFDLGRISRLHKACFEDGWSRSDIAHLLSLPGSFGLICRSQDVAFPGIETTRGVGFALCRVAKDESELLSIGVLPEHRRRNVAGKLLEAGMARCRAAGCGRHVPRSGARQRRGAGGPTPASASSRSACGRTTTPAPTAPG